MEIWISTVIRQMILYSLPVISTLVCMALLEQYLLRKKHKEALTRIFWHGSWLPLFAGIFFTRGLIFPLLYPGISGLRGAAVRFLGHAALCLLGLALYSWSLAHPPANGLPALHHWWAKILMYMNLCLLAIHLLPIPGLLIGEYLLKQNAFKEQELWIRKNNRAAILVIAALAASPLPDLILGGLLVYPTYEWLASLAT